MEKQPFLLMLFFLMKPQGHPESSDISVPNTGDRIPIRESATYAKCSFIWELAPDRVPLLFLLYLRGSSVGLVLVLVSVATDGMSVLMPVGDSFINSDPGNTLMGQAFDSSHFTESRQGH